MAHKTVGQGNLAEGFLDLHAGVHCFDGMYELVDWDGVAATLREVYASERGRPSYPPVVLFRCLLLQQWYGLSDMGLEAQLGRDLAFRRFAGLSLADAVPDHSTLSRFRSLLAARKLGERLFAAVTGQMERRGLTVKRGTLIDATIIESPRGTRKDGTPVDSQARWTVKHGEPYYGYKLHIGMDRDSQLIRKAHVTDASVHDGRVAERLISGDEKEVYGDKAYQNAARTARWEERGIRNGVMRRDTTRTSPWNAARNRILSGRRAPVERPFARIKCHFGLTLTRYIGLSRNACHFLLSVIAYNLSHAAVLLQKKALAG